jgi:hypothetical protein
VLKNKNPNIEMLEIAVERLGKLIDDVVFLGGCATGLLLTDPAAPPIRATRDVDVMVEVASLAGYHSFNEKLRRRGFKEDSSPEAPICRWQSERIILDVMPTDPELLGFGNQWFARAFPVAHSHRLPSGASIRVLPSPLFSGDEDRGVPSSWCRGFPSQQGCRRCGRHNGWKAGNRQRN